MCVAAKVMFLAKFQKNRINLQYRSTISNHVLTLRTSTSCQIFPGAPISLCGATLQIKSLAEGGFEGFALAFLASYFLDVLLLYNLQARGILPEVAEYKYSKSP